MKRLLILLALLALLIIPVSATWIQAGEFEQTASSVYSTSYANKSSDGNNATIWNANGAGGWLNWSNPSGYKIDAVRILAGPGASGNAYPISTAGSLGVYTAFGSTNFVQINFTSGGLPTNTTGFIKMQYFTSGDWSNAAEIQYGIGESIPEPTEEKLVVGYTCNAPPVPVQSPFSLICTDASDAYPAINRQNWTLTQPDASIYKTSNATLAKQLTAYGWYGLEYEACNSAACGYQNTTTLVNLSATAGAATGISLLVDIKDAAFPNAFIQGASFGIQNTTSGEWGNTTATYGALELSDIKGIKLSSNQTVQICAKATGYPEETCDTFEIPYDGYLATLYLTKTGDVPSGGNWNLIVTAKKNIDGTPLNSATIKVTTGVSGGPGTYQAITDDNGVATFMNISASSTATIEAIAQGYQYASVVKTVVPNTTQYHTFSLVRIGQTPLATPIPTTTYTYVATTKPGDAYPVPTDAYGNPITDEVQKGYAAWGILIDAAYAIMMIAVSLIFIWLLWMTVYLITGGDIIQKIMRRGRR